MKTIMTLSIGVVALVAFADMALAQQSPGVYRPSLAVKKTGSVKTVNLGALNPQPLPPDKLPRFANGWRYLNPQPLPPEPPDKMFRLPQRSFVLPAFYRQK